MWRIGWGRNVVQTLMHKAQGIAATNVNTPSILTAR